MRKPNTEEYKDLRWFLERLKRAEDYCNEYFERGKRWYRLWRFGSAVDEADWPYVNRVRTKDIFAFCEDSTALMIASLLATMPWYSVIPRETATFAKMTSGLDPMEIGAQLEKCLAYQVEHEDTEFFEEMVDFVKNGDMMGNSYMGVYPKIEPDGRYLHPLLKGHEFWDVMPIPRATRLTRSKGVFVREFMTPEDLEDLKKKGFKNIDNVIADTPAGMDIEWHKNLLQELGMESYVMDENSKETLHYFSGGHVVSMVDRGAIIRDTRKDSQKPFPYDLPIVQYKYIPVPFEFFGMGIPEVLEVLQEDRNLIRSARRDNIDFIIHKIVMFREGAGLNLDLLKAYPNAMWPVTDLTNDIKEFDIKDVSQSAYNEEQLIAHDEENALSLFGYARGMTPEHSEQPTTVMKLQQASLNRLDLNTKLIEFGPFRSVAARIILLTRRYMRQEDYEEIIGEPDAGFYQLSEEQIRRFFYAKPVGSSITQIKEMRQQQMNMMIQALMQIEERVPMSATPFKVDWYEVGKGALDAGEIQEPDKYIKPIQPQEQSPMGEMPGQDMMGQLAQQMYSGGGP